MLYGEARTMERLTPGDNTAEVGDKHYAESLWGRIANALDSVVRERYVAPIPFTIEWRDGGTEPIEIAGFEMRIDEWVRVEVASTGNRETTYREFDLNQAENAWVVDVGSGERLLYSHNDETLQQWKADHPGYQDTGDEMPDGLRPDR